MFRRKTHRIDPWSIVEAKLAHQKNAGRMPALQQRQRFLDLRGLAYMADCLRACCDCWKALAACSMARRACSWPLR